MLPGCGGRGLGHADVKTTMERYAALSPGFMRTVAA
jgi:hypothetical protein